MVVFDTLTFTGVPAAQPLSKKRSIAPPHHHELHMIYDPTRDGLVHARHNPLLAHAVNTVLRKRGEANLVDATPVAGAPHRDNFATTMAAGSVDATGSDGSSAGDHPLRLFPQTYSAPLTLDPVVSAASSEPTIYDGQLVTGAPQSFCTIGQVGCQCRDASAATLCDAPFSCNTVGFCVQPLCTAGLPGCPALADGSCLNGTLTSSVGGFCQFGSQCTAGVAGCTCTSTGTCSTGLSCLDNQCITPMSGVCANGSPGCPCDSTGSCTGGASCNDLSGMCEFQSCSPGANGCTCNTAVGASSCNLGFTCSGSFCLQTPCPAGTAGCPCLSDSTCGIVGFSCTDLTRDGTQNACLAENLCPGEQTASCLKECGAGNIAVCGNCTYSRPICRDPTVQYCNPKSYLYMAGPCPPGFSSDAATTTLAVFLALAALVAAM